MSDPDKLVSVVVANYNMGKYLAEAVNSALNQTYPHIEVNVVDDGSTDDSRQVMEQFAGDARVRYHYQANGGQAKAKNLGIRESRGAFIGFLDADDLWSADKVEKQLPGFTSDKIGIVYTHVQFIDPNGRPLPTPRQDYYTGRISDQLLIDNFVTGMCSIVRRECFDTLGLFDESLPMGIDYDLWMRFSTRYEFAFIDEATYFYRQWPGQMSHNQAKRFDCAMMIMRRFLEQNPGLVDPAKVHEAWAHTFVARGNSVWRGAEKSRTQALGFYVKALKESPLYGPAWRAIAKVALPDAAVRLVQRTIGDGV